MIEWPGMPESRVLWVRGGKAISGKDEESGLIGSITPSEVVRAHAPHAFSTQ